MSHFLSPSYPFLVGIGSIGSFGSGPHLETVDFLESTPFETPPKERRLLRANGWWSDFRGIFSARAEEAPSSGAVSKRRAFIDILFSGLIAMATTIGRACHAPGNPPWTSIRGR